MGEASHNIKAERNRAVTCKHLKFCCLSCRANRVHILVATALLAAAVVATLVAALRLWIVYLLLTLQCCITSVQYAARQALLPRVVAEQDLQTAVTLDSFCWSLTGAVGAAIGGVVAAQLGITACFLLVRQHA